MSLHCAWPFLAAVCLLFDVSCSSGGAVCTGFCIGAVFGTLTNGGCLALFDIDTARDPNAIIRLMRNRDITRVLCVPSLGQAILDAAQLALFESGSDRLILVPRDTGGNAAGSAGAARAVIGDGARLILGPLLAPEVEAVKPIAQEAHINVIAFSTVTSLAGGNTYLMGFLPRQEVVREVGYARERGLARFAALAPNSPYGHLMADALREAASGSGGSVIKVEFFDPRAGDASPAIQRLLPGGGAEGNAEPAPVSPPAASFDALLLP